VLVQTYRGAVEVTGRAKPIAARRVGRGGVVKCWGYNYDGQLATATGRIALCPVTRCGGLSGAVQIAAAHGIPVR